jgi:transcriptional regulator GlxA family with amidase domain
MKSAALLKKENVTHPVFNIMTTLLKELVELGCSLSDIAKHTQVSLRTLRRVYRGETAQPSQQTFSRVLSFYCHQTSRVVEEKEPTS